MIRVRVQCEGISPLLMNPMTDEILDELFTGRRSVKRRDLSYKEAAEEKLYCQNGHIGLPALNLFSCLVEAGKFLKVAVGGSRPTQISTNDKTLLPSFLEIEEEFLAFPNGATWVVDKRRGVMDQGGKKTAVCVVRPKFPEWGFPVTIKIDDSQMKEDNVRQLFELAGSRVGLCDFRPACRGPFGRFRVKKWEVIERTEPEKKSKTDGDEAGAAAKPKRGRKAVTAALVAPVIVLLSKFWTGLTGAMM